MKVDELLYAGANDFGSIMIEENVVAADGARFRFTADGIQESIRETRYIPQRRNQDYEHIKLPENMVQQQLDRDKMIVD